MQQRKTSFRLCILSIILIAITSACSPVNYFLSKPLIDPRKDIFASKPIWENTELTAPKSPSGLIAPQETSLEQVNQKRPNLKNLVSQVFPSKNTASAALTSDQAGPLPQAIAREKVTQVLVGKMYKQHLALNNVSAALSDEALKDINIPETLSFDDFLSFKKTLLSDLIKPFQETNFLENNDLSLVGEDINWASIYSAYFMAYYAGNFVDRNGGQYTKPKIGLTISNEVISNVAIIFLEATIDYSLVNASGINAPIVYLGDVTKPKWVTAGNRQPTFVEFAKGLKLWPEPQDSKPKPQLIVQADEKTIDAPRLCVARYVGGISGDVAQPLSGMIVRTIGGANLGVTFGLGALGKFSFGDNDTLTKLIDSFVETLSKRLTEITVEHALYGEGKGNSKLVKLAEMISECNNDAILNKAKSD